MTVGTASADGLRLLSQHDLGGRGDGMQVLREGDVLYVAHNGTTGAGTSILDVSDPARPRLVRQWDAPANTHTHKVQIADGLLLVNHEGFPLRPPGPQGPWSAGLAVYSLEDPLDPQQIGFWECGGRGVHRIVWEGGRYAHMSATPPGFNDRIWVVVDMLDPTNPVPVAKWWWPGQWVEGGEQPTWPEGKRYAAHHALLDGDRAYLGYDDANLVVLDVSDMTAPKQVDHLSWGGDATHTCLPLPGRGLVVATDEQQKDGPGAHELFSHVLDVSGEQARYVSRFPSPGEQYLQQELRCGPHNFHENRAGSYRSERVVFATYFNAGVRVYDLADPEHVEEVAHWVSTPPEGQPVPQANDLFVDAAGLVWVTDRGSGGVACLQPEDGLAALMAEAAQ
ncbi:MAG: hypothetical protein JWO11_1379 [Nocardioides sp.]|nr:hypothetical protein [Nocardioides sp.]